MGYKFNPFTKKLDIVNVAVVPPGTVGTLSGNTGGAVSPDSGGNINVIGDGQLTVTGTPVNNTLTISQINYLTGTVTTVDATNGNLLSFNLGSTPGSYMFQFQITGFDGASPTATGYWFAATARTTGSTATVVGTDEAFVEDAALVSSDVNMTATGNVVTVVVTGVAGKTLDWSGIGYYVKAV